MSFELDSNTTVDYEETIDYGIFGKKILSKYCGTDIASQFYSHSQKSDEPYGMLLTEKQMGQIVIQNMVEIMAYTLLVISIQTIGGLYWKSIKNSCDSFWVKHEQNENKPGNEPQPGCCERCVNSDNRAMKSARGCASFVTIILGLTVLGHFGLRMWDYYQFVDQTVVFNENDISSTYEFSSETEMHEGMTKQMCEESGNGQLACPALFYQFKEYTQGYYENTIDEITEGYSAQNAQNTCRWIFYLSIASNPDIFRYSVLASLFIFDTIIYFAILFLTTATASCCCNCGAWLSCWCCCCPFDNVCCPFPKCCCQVNWAWCCEADDAGACCACTPKGHSLTYVAIFEIHFCVFMYNYNYK